MNRRTFKLYIISMKAVFIRNAPMISQLEVLIAVATTKKPRAHSLTMVDTTAPLMREPMIQSRYKDIDSATTVPTSLSSAQCVVRRREGEVENPNSYQMIEYYNSKAKLVTETS